MKLLMLHAYTQNGDVFQRKLRRFTAGLSKAFPGVTFEFLDGPIHLKTSDIPNDPSDGALAGGDPD